MDTRIALMSGLAEQSRDPEQLRTLLELGARPGRIACDPDIDPDDRKYHFSTHRLAAVATTDTEKLERYVQRGNTRAEAAGNPACPPAARLAAITVAVQDGEPLEERSWSQALHHAASHDPYELAQTLEGYRPSGSWSALTEAAGRNHDYQPILRVISHTSGRYQEQCLETVTETLAQMARLDGDTAKMFVDAGHHGYGLPRRALGGHGELHADTFLELRNSGVLTDEMLERDGDTSRGTVRPISRATLDILLARSQPAELAWALSRSTDRHAVGDEDKPTLEQLLQAAAVQLDSGDPRTARRAAAAVHAWSTDEAATNDETTTIDRHATTLTQVLTTPEADRVTYTLATSSPQRARWLLTHGQDSTSRCVSTVDRIASHRTIDSDHPAVRWAVEQAHRAEVAEKLVTPRYLLAGTCRHPDILAAAVANAVGSALAYSDASPQVLRAIAGMLAGKLNTYAALTCASTLLADGWSGTLDALVDSAQELSRVR